MAELRGGGRCGLWAAAWALAAALAGLLVLAPGAAGAMFPDRIIAGQSTNGSAAGQLNNVRGVAVNDSGVVDGAVDPLGVSSDGFVYVADMRNDRVQVFDSDGNFRFMLGSGVAGGAGGEVCDASELPCTAAVSGPGAGEFRFPQGVAVNQQTGDFYVSEIGNLRVQQFAADGSFIRMWGWGVDDGSPGFQVCEAPADLPCQAGIDGENGGQFGTASLFTRFMDVAVDPATPHHVFVGDPGNGRLHQYTPDGSFVRLWGWDVVAAGQPGDIDSNSFEICETTDPGVCNAYETVSGDDPLSGRFGNSGPGPIAIDGTNKIVYSSSIGNWSARIQRFDSDQLDPAGLLLEQFSAVAGLGGSISPPGLAVRGSHLLIARDSAGLPVQEVDVSVDPPVEVDRHLDGAERADVGQVQALAVEGSTDVLYLSATDFSIGDHVFGAVEGGAGPAAMAVDEPTVHSETEATFTGTVTPGGAEGFSTDYNFQYSLDGETWTTVPASGNPLGDGSTPIVVSDTVNTLEAGRVYRLRLRTRKAFGNPYAFSAEQTFVTKAIPPDVETVYPQAVGPDSATITGLVRPNGSPTSFYFEWGTDTSYGNLAPIPAGSAGDGADFEAVSVRLDGLQPDTGYHYRVVADNGVEVAPGETEVRGDDIAFTTRPTTPQPPGRAFELVSPADKCGGQGVGFWPNGVAHVNDSGVAAHVGERFAAQGQFGSVIDCDGGFSFANDWVFAERADSQRGWLSRSPITHPNHNPATAQTVGLQSAARDFSAFYWNAASTMAFFPEMIGPAVDPVTGRAGWGGIAAGLMSDWGGPLGDQARWELFGPASLDQVAHPSELASGGELLNVAFADDRSTAIAQARLTTSGLPQVHGLAGADDPTWPSPPVVAGAPEAGDLVAGRSIWSGDLSGGLADSFAGTGERVLVNACTGSAGVDRTVLPAVDADGDVGAVECPAGNGGRQALVSDRGAAFATTEYIRPGSVSEDGSRVFFLAPDPAAAGVPNGTSQQCTGTGADSLCPSQLFVSQRNPGGSVVTRWVSMPELIGEQDASLLGTTRFEGASADGSRVFFRTNSPLTADDPNGGCGTPCLTGTPHAESWDLYMFELSDGPDPTGPGSSLTRISAGPTADGDCNSPMPALNGGVDVDSVGALRFASADGSRVYFTCQAPLAGAEVSATPNAATAPDGTTSTTDAANLYLYDDNLPQAQRWLFIARLPRKVGTPILTCASTGVVRQSPLTTTTGASVYIAAFASVNDDANCVEGTADGTFISLLTHGRLTDDDPFDRSPAGNPVIDIYGYDADADELTRITAPQGGNGQPYPCLGDRQDIEGDESLLYGCRGDHGTDQQQGVVVTSAPIPVGLGMATDPQTPGDRVAFFESASRLTVDDQDDGYDVYEWRNGELSLLTDGSPDSEDAFYKGNDRTGRNVYLVTRQALSWQDHDVVADIYTARTGGGIDQPPAPPACAVLAGGCHGGGAGELAEVPIRTASPPAVGNAEPAARPQVVLGRLGPRARRRAARTGVLVVRVRANRAGRVAVVARARVGGRLRRVGRSVRRVKRGEVIRVRLRLSRRVRRRLARGRRVVVVVRANAPGARPARTRLLLGGGRR